MRKNLVTASKSQTRCTCGCGSEHETVKSARKATTKSQAEVPKARKGAAKPEPKAKAALHEAKAKPEPKTKRASAVKAAPTKKRVSKAKAVPQPMPEPTAQPVQEHLNFTPGRNWLELKCPVPLESDQLIDAEGLLLYYGISPHDIEKLREESSRECKNPDDPQRFPLPVKSEGGKEYWSLSAVRKWHWCRVFQTALNNYFWTLALKPPVAKHVDWLCEAVLETIFLAYRESRKAAPSKQFAGLTPSEISKLAGLYREDDDPEVIDAIVTAILYKLSWDNKADELVTRKWTFTKAELDARRRGS